MAAIENLKIRPYARLLTMLGEQLIKNERIALIELIKNSYDADSPWVKISFIGFDDDFAVKSTSRIIIEDNGYGMSEDIVRKHWLNPATPEKKRQKAEKTTTHKGRIIQGDKGIGRFAILKLGRKIKIITRAKGENVERVLDYDFSQYDDNFLSENGREKDLFIDDLSVALQTRPVQYFKVGSLLVKARRIVRLPHGTRIEISNLKGAWSEDKVEKVYRDVTRLQSIFSENVHNANKDKHKDDFSVWIYKDYKLQSYSEEYKKKLAFLLKERAVFRIEEGEFDESKMEFRFKINDKPKSISIKDPPITGLNVFSKHFGKGGDVLKWRRTECGSFGFGFYVFDFRANAPLKYKLDNEDKKIIRDHRIYLYRDGIRVYPYGEPDDDWLGIDIHRGTVSAAQFLSNDQVVGYVNISQRQNPHLEDKTNREGLLDQGNATEDFVTLLKTILRYIREHDYKKYIFDGQSKNRQDIFRTKQVLRGLTELNETVKDNRKARELLTTIQKQYVIERQYLIQRAETTEDLAGVGLSVETASHDIMTIMEKVMVSIDGLIRDSIHDDIDKEALQKELQTLRGMISFIEAQLKDIQLLFKSSKQKRRNIRLKEIIEKVERIYLQILKKEGIEFSVEQIGSPLIAKTTDAVLLQLFLNLFDNAVYWLQQASRKEKRIAILLDGSKGQMIFSDNGPGVSKDDAPYIFEPFYSGKGEEGRGLGLYIARQLLERHDYSIWLAELRSEKILPGANFVVNFVSEVS